MRQIGEMAGMLRRLKGKSQQDICNVCPVKVRIHMTRSPAVGLHRHLPWISNHHNYELESEDFRT